MNQDTLRSRMQEAAGMLDVSPVMPAHVNRGIRLRQTGLVTGAALSLIALLSVGIFLTTPGPERVDPIFPAGEGETVRLARGNAGGVPWELTLRADTIGAQSEVVCVDVKGESVCGEISSYGKVVGKIGLRYIEPLDMTLIVAKSPQDVGFSVRELNGTNWASLSADHVGAPDAPAYWYRFLDGDEVKGVITVAGRNLRFEVSRKGNTVHEGIAAGGNDYPELQGLPGDKQLLGSGPDGGGYSIFLRRTDSEVCLHINDQSGCRSASAPAEPVGLAVSKVLPCGRGEDCGTDNGFVVIVGEVTPEVFRVGIRDDIGTSWVYLDQPTSVCCHFVAELYGQVGDEVELIAFDEDGNELGSQAITYE